MSLILKGLVGTPEGQTEQKEAATTVQGTDVKQVQANKEEQGNQNRYKACPLEILSCVIMKCHV